MSSEGWREVLLGEVLTFQRGFDITKAQQRPGPFLVYSSSGPNSSHAEFRVRGPGVIIGRKGSLGTVFYTDREYWPHDTTLWIRDFHGNVPRFAFYFLQTLGLERYDAGASNPSLNRNHIHKLSVFWPTIPSQRRIAEILSSYDNLIDNNLRRIRILDEMARTIYREWFVDFRFPGHEEVAVAEDETTGRRPVDWGVRPLLEVATVVYGHPFASAKFNTAGSGTPIVRIRDIPAGLSQTWTDEVADPKYFIANGDILVGMDGDFHMCIWSGGAAYQNQRVARFKSAGEIGTYHLLLALEDPIQRLNRSIVGTTVVHLGDKHIQEIALLWPREGLIRLARTVLDPMAEQILLLRQANSILLATRDLLLPRLMSGRLSLAAAEAAVP
jgi:type I restriction enzyme, S subunit